MAAANTAPNPLQALGQALLSKAVEYLPSALGVQNKPSGQTNIAPSETKGTVAAGAEAKPAWYQQPAVLIVGAVALVAVLIFALRD